MSAKCAARTTEERVFQFTIPQSIFITKQEEDRIKVPLVEKPLAQGPASSLSGRLFKVQYVLQFSLKHSVMGAGQKTMPEAQIPVMIMTPIKSTLSSSSKSQVAEMGGAWEPIVFDSPELYMTAEMEAANDYARFRRWLIQKVSALIPLSVLHSCLSFFVAYRSKNS